MKRKMTIGERQLFNGCIDMMDRADPANRDGSRPSERMREAYRFRRHVRQTAACILLFAAGIAFAVWLTA